MGRFFVRFSFALWGILLLHLAACSNYEYPNMSSSSSSSSSSSTPSESFSLYQINSPGNDPNPRVRIYNFNIETSSIITLWEDPTCNTFSLPELSRNISGHEAIIQLTALTADAPTAVYFKIDNGTTELCSSDFGQSLTYYYDATLPSNLSVAPNGGTMFGANQHMASPPPDQCLGNRRRHDRPFLHRFIL